MVFSSVFDIDLLRWRILRRLQLPFLRYRTPSADILLLAILFKVYQERVELERARELSKGIDSLWFQCFLHLLIRDILRLS
jgi:transcriptional regulator with AAA-type ATPase domain